ncbi:MAG: hypothetical protein MI861_19925, partial [Pirellulales bacterium]|nr:hypothetical protein [Pirellulales bacterium]
MRKEVKRSLVLWPSLASATIVAVVWLGRPDGPAPPWFAQHAKFLAGDLGGSQWPDSPQFNSLEEVSEERLEHLIATPDDLLSAERREHGARAMRPPERLAALPAYGADPKRPPQLPAPIIDERQETAGLVTKPAHPIEAVEPLWDLLWSMHHDAMQSQQADQQQTPQMQTSQVPTSQADVKSDADDSSSLVVEAVENATAQVVAPQKRTPTKVVSEIDEDPTLAAEVVPESANVEAVEETEAEPTAPERQLADSLPPLVGPELPEFAATQPPASGQPSVPPLLPKSVEQLGKLEPAQPESQTAPVVPQQPTPQVSLPAKPAATAPESAQANPAGWPQTVALDDQLSRLSALVKQQIDHRSASLSHHVMETWIVAVRQRLDQLQSLPRIGDLHAGDLVDELADLADEGLRHAELLEDRTAQIQWLCVSHAIARRAAVWAPVWRIAQNTEPTWMVSDDREQSDRSVIQAVRLVRSELAETGDEGGWNRYLLLDEVMALADSDELEQRQITAQRLLSRLVWHGLRADQRAWLERDSIEQFAEAIRPWARSAVDYAKLLGHVERQESDAIDLAAIEIANSVQALRFAENPAATEVAQALDTYYRNANVRMAISETMLQKMLPSIDPQAIPVRTQLFGSKVRGVGQVRSRLAVQLNPSANRWSIELRTHGDVRTQSTGFNGPVAVRTSGDSLFTAATPIEVGPNGIHTGQSRVQVSGSTRLRGIRTDYDGWPLVGSLVQSIAASRYESVAPQSNRISNRKIQYQVGNEIDTQLDQRVDEATKRLSRMVLGPLGTLQLDPKVVDMATTQERLLARYRLAGDWQLAAFTPRPRAPRSSLMSLQVHQSALNNTLEQLVPRDEPKSIEAIVNEGLEMFGQPATAMPDDIPDDVTVQFASTRPITIEIHEGEFWLTLRVMRLTRGERLDLRRFIVRAKYVPNLEGLEASLVRDGHLRISGPKMSMRQRLPVRAIFNKVLSPNRPLKLTLPQLVDHPIAKDLAVSQLELR